MNLKLTTREAEDLLHALDYAIDDYGECIKAGVDKEDEVMYEGRIQRCTVIYNRVEGLIATAAQKRQA